MLDKGTDISVIPMFLSEILLAVALHSTSFYQTCRHFVGSYFFHAWILLSCCIPSDETNFLVSTQCYVTCIYK